MRNIVNQLEDMAEGNTFLKACTVILLAALIVFTGYIIGSWFGDKVFR